jgi:hypothetical protein
MATIPVPGGFEIPDILKLGPSTDVGVSFEVDSIEGDATIMTGATASIPDTARQRLISALTTPQSLRTT